MVLFAILALILLITLIVVIVAVGMAGAGMIILFGDVIVCIILLAWVIKKLYFKKK